MTSKTEESSNGDSASINRNKIGYHSHDTNFFQTKFSKLKFSNFEDKNRSEWI